MRLIFAVIYKCVCSYHYVLKIMQAEELRRLKIKMLESKLAPGTQLAKKKGEVLQAHQVTSLTTHSCSTLDFYVCHEIVYL